MAGTATPICPQLIVGPATQILPADTTALKSIITGGANGTKIESINVASTDTSDRDVSLWVTIAAVAYLLGTVKIPATSGLVDSVPSVSLLDSPQFTAWRYDSNGNKYLYLPVGAILSISALTTVTTAKAIQVYAQGGNF